MCFTCIFISLEKKVTTTRAVSTMCGNCADFNVLHTAYTMQCHSVREEERYWSIINICMMNLHRRPRPQLLVITSLSLTPTRQPTPPPPLLHTEHRSRNVTQRPAASPVNPFFFFFFVPSLTVVVSVHIKPAAEWSLTRRPEGMNPVRREDELPQVHVYLEMNNKLHENM